jgi:TPR repeat protein
MLLQSAQKELPAAHYYLGRAYFEGWGVEKNDPKALVHMVAAADLNYGKGQLSAAQFYALGVGSPVNFELAAKYAGMAALSNVPKAKELFQEYEIKWRESGTRPPQPPLEVVVPEPEDTLGPQEGRSILPPTTLARPPDPLPRPPVQSNVATQEILTKAQTALRLNNDVRTALILYQEAADAGNVMAQREFGELYYEGSFVARDYHAALKWFRKAADGGDAAAQRYLGAMYFIGKGLAKDKQEAARWLRRAAAQGDTLAQEQLKMVERLLRP